jgi:PAS domain S-box-containing protein
MTKLCEPAGAVVEEATSRVQDERAQEEAGTGKAAATGQPPTGQSQHEIDERFRILIDSVKEYAIFMLDPDGYVSTWNSGAQRIKGYRADEIIGKHFSTFYPEEDLRAGKTEYELEVAASEGRFEDEGWRIRKDGSRFWANVVITALRDTTGKLIGFAKITRDLTERKKHEEQRIRLVQAEEAVRLRDEFLSIASHELKTPLSVLRMQLEMLRKRFDGSDPSIATKLERTHRAGQRLSELVEMLLDVSRIATGKFELHSEPFDLSELVREIVDRMVETASASRCTVTCQLEDTLPGTWDRSRVDQLITNLLANAFKYAAGTPVELTLREQDDVAVLEVRDRGPGLPEGREAELFGRFERAASMQHYAGLGLGLYVVDQIVRAHGGTASAANAAGGGARFRVELPVSPKAMSSSA